MEYNYNLKGSGLKNRDNLEHLTSLQCIGAGHLSYEHLFHSVTSQPCHLAVKQEVLYYHPTILFFFTLGAWTASIRYVGDKKKTHS